MILSIDSSLSVLSVALVAERPVAAVLLESERSRNEKLLPAIDWLLSESGTGRDQLDLIVVTRGPGSFTGVRVGLATAQGLAFALGIPLWGVSTHEAVVEEDHSSLLVHTDAGRGEFYVSGFRQDHEVLSPSLASPEELERLRRQFDASIDLSQTAAERNVALVAALRAARLRSEGRLEMLGEATPIYVRLSEAEVRLARKC